MQHAVILDLGLDHLGILVVILVQDLALIHHKEVVEDLEEDMEVAEELDLPEAVEVIGNFIFAISRKIKIQNFNGFFWEVFLLKFFHMEYLIVYHQKLRHF